MSNMFAQAKAKAAPKTKAKKKADRDTVAVKELNVYAAIDSVMKALEAHKEIWKDSIHNQMRDYFVETGLQQKAQPKNFAGIDTRSTASCQLRKLTSRSSLSAANREQLKELGVPYETVNDVVETFRINPKYADNEALQKKVSAALSKVKGLPEDFIEYQTGESRHIVTDDSLKTAFTTLDQEQLQQALSIIGTLAVRAQFNGSTTDAMQYLIDEGLLEG